MNDINEKTDVVVEVPDIGQPIVVPEPKKPKKPNRKLPVIPIAVSIVVVSIVLVVAIVVFSGNNSNNKVGFGTTSELTKIVVTASDSSIDAELNSLQGIESLKELSGVVIEDKKGGTVAKVGDQVNINYAVYVYTAEQIAQPTNQQSTANSTALSWQYAGSSFEEGQSLPIIVADTSSDSGSKSLSELVGESNSSSSANSTGQSQMLDKISTLLNGQGVGAVVAFYIPPQASQTGQQTAGQLIIGEISYIGAKGDDPDAPDVTSEVPNDAPTIAFENGQPTTLTVPDTFEQSSASISKVVVQVLEEGTGATVNSTDTVSAVYAGYTLDGKQFDASAKHGDGPSEFSLARVIKGWQTGIAGQKVGSKLILLIPSKYAYGANGQPNAGISANAFLVFYVEIAKTTDAQSATDAQDSSDGYDGE